MRLSTVLKTGIAAVGAFALIGGSPAAAEALDSYSTGAHAFSYGSHASAAVTDTAADSHGVYVIYARQSGSQHETRNYNGRGSTAYSSTSSTNPVAWVQACTDIQLAPDDCGSIDYDS